MSTRSRSVTARRTFWCAVESGRFVRVVLVIFVCSPNTSRVLAGRTRRFSSPWLIRALVSAFLLHLVVSHASKIFAFPTTTVDAYSANEVSIDETMRSHPLFLFFLSFFKRCAFYCVSFCGAFCWPSDLPSHIERRNYLSILFQVRRKKKIGCRPSSVGCLVLFEFRCDWWACRKCSWMEKKSFKFQHVRYINDGNASCSGNWSDW